MAKTYSTLLVGVDVLTVEIETMVGSGFSGLNILGVSPDAARDMRERIRSALESVGILIPARRVVVNVTPSQVIKLTRTPLAQLDFAVAASILYALFEDKEQEKVFYPPKKEFLAGELSLLGDVKEIHNPLIYESVLATNEASSVLCLPSANQKHFSAQRRFPQFFSNLAQWIEMRKTDSRGSDAFSSKSSSVSFSAVKKEEKSQRQKHVVETILTLGKNPKICVAMLVAAIGRHHILVAGEPGVGKSFSLQKLPLLLPPLTETEVIDVKLINPAIASHERPFRSPHHSATAAALVGGSSLKPGEVSLAHHGVLFLDELTEFPRPTLEALREPLDTGSVCLAKAGGSITYPARFHLCATTNPCSCGFLFSRSKPCRCLPHESRKYLQKISGPLLDRFCLQVWLEPAERDPKHDIFSRFLLTLIQKKEVEEFAQRFLSVQESLYGKKMERNEEESQKMLKEKNLSLRGEEKIRQLVFSFSQLFPSLQASPCFMGDVLRYRELGHMFSSRLH